MYLVNVVIAKGYLHFPTKFVGLWDVQRTTKSVWGNKMGRIIQRMTMLTDAERIDLL
jgi:hypothetical protein